MSRKVFDDSLTRERGAMLTKAVDGFDEFEAALRRAWEIQNIRAELAGHQADTANRFARTCERRPRGSGSQQEL